MNRAQQKKIFPKGCIFGARKKEIRKRVKGIEEIFVQLATAKAARQKKRRKKNEKGKKEGVKGKKPRTVRRNDW